MHDLGLKLIDGRLSGVAIISGAPNNTSLFIDILRDFYSKNILCFITDGLSANTLSLLYKDNTVGVDMGTRILPLRGGPLSLIYALNFMIRIPLLYGNIAPGEFNNLKSYLNDLPIISDLTPKARINARRKRICHPLFLIYKEKVKEEELAFEFEAEGLSFWFTEIKTILRMGLSSCSARILAKIYLKKILFL